MKFLDRVALVATLLCPLFLLHARVVAEGLISVTAFCFLIRSAIDRDWSWLRAAWVRIAIAWWAWVILCSLQGGLVQALVLVRFLLFVAALEHWVLRLAWRRLWLAQLTALAALYIAFQSVVQLVTGRNIQGYARWGDGELTGPFEHPRAAAPLSRILFPALMLVRGRWTGLCVMLAGVAVMVLIGQRMPLLLTGLGLLVTGLLLPRFRPVVLIVAAAAIVLLGASAIIEPPTFYRLVTKFSDQMADFPDSPYGQIAARAAAMIQQHPIFGLGFDGFRRGCADPANMRGLPRLGVPTAGQNGGLEACNIHPHNYLLEAADDAGLPGLAAFALMACALLFRLGRQTGPLGAGVFVAALVAFWPLATTSAFTSLPNAGWIFLVAGMGLAARSAGPGRVRLTTSAP